MPVHNISEPTSQITVSDYTYTGWGWEDPPTANFIGDGLPVELSHYTIRGVYTEYYVFTNSRKDKFILEGDYVTGDWASVFFPTDLIWADGYFVYSSDSVTSANSWIKSLLAGPPQVTVWSKTVGTGTSGSYADETEYNPIIYYGDFTMSSFAADGSSAVFKRVKGGNVQLSGSIGSGTLAVRYLKPGGDEDTDADFLPLYDGATAVSYTASPYGDLLDFGGETTIKFTLSGSTTPTLLLAFLGQED